MTDYFEGVSSTNLDNIVTNTARMSSTPSSYTTLHQYDLDGVGNRRETLANGLVDNAYRLDGDDWLTNQYTWVNDVFQSHDKAGNQSEDGSWRYFYSASNLLLRAVSGTSDVRYRHDVRGRRISKQMINGNFLGLGYSSAFYIYGGPQLLEEIDAAGVRRKEWVYWGLDELIRQIAPDSADTDSDGNTTEERQLWYLSNSIATVVALADSGGTVRERYKLNVWGETNDVFGKSGASTGQEWTKVGNPWLLIGRQRDFEERTNLLDVRARALDPTKGRFLQRDPIGAWGDVEALGSGYSYASNNPANRLDPLGLSAQLAGQLAHRIAEKRLGAESRSPWYNRSVSRIVGDLKSPAPYVPFKPQIRPDVVIAPKAEKDSPRTVEVYETKFYTSVNASETEAQLNGYIKLLREHLSDTTFKVEKGTSWNPTDEVEPSYAEKGKKDAIPCRAKVVFTRYAAGLISYKYVGEGKTPPEPATSFWANPAAANAGAKWIADEYGKGQKDTNQPDSAAQKVEIGDPAETGALGHGDPDPGANGS